MIRFGEGSGSLSGSSGSMLGGGLHSLSALVTDIFCQYFEPY